MGIRHGDKPTRRSWLAIVTPIALLAGVLAGVPAAAVAVAPAGASTSVSSNFVYACGDSFMPGRATCLVIKNTAVHPAAQTVHPGAIPTGKGYGPSDLQLAYNLTSASTNDGTGMTVAVVDAFNDPTAAADLAAYRAAAGLPTLTAGQFTQYNQLGQTSPLPAEAPATDDWTQEETMDVDMVSAICPNCKIDLVEADNDMIANMFLAEQAAATTLGAKYISNSWGTPGEAAGENTLDPQYFGVSGVVYVAGAADTGYAGGMTYPAASPNVVSVGGTTLQTSSNSRGWTESVWDTLGASAGAGATGSGCSAYEPQPSWQASIPIISAACSKRVDNDIAADADPSTGAAIYDTSNGNGGWFEAGGNSESSPIIAAVFALARNSGNGGSNDGNNAAESIYKNASGLYEVTASNNGTCTESVLCTATGAANTYNGPTGWGTPNGITAFQSVANTVTVTNPGNQTGTVGTAISNLQIGATDSASGQTLTYGATGLPAGLSINSSTGVISGTPTTTGTGQVKVTATDATGAAGSASFTWTITTAASNSSSPSASASASASPTASASASPTCCSASATPAPSTSASSAAAAPTPSAVSTSLAVTG